MTDYYPLLARAVSRLEDNSGQARLDLYDRARAILIAQLRAHERKSSEAELMDELVAFEMAILKLEAEAPPALPRSMPAQPPVDPAPRTAADAAAVTGGATAIVAVAAGTVRDERLTPAEAKGPPASPSPAETIEAGSTPTTNAADDIGALPQSLGIMLIGTAVVVGMLAFIGVIYVRGLALVSARVIAYPALIAVVALLSILLVVLYLATFRRLRVLAAVAYLLKLAHATLGRGAASF